MVHLENFHESKMSDSEQVMNISDFNKLDMGDTRTVSGGAWYEDKTHKKRFFIKPTFTWTSDNSDTVPLCLKESPIMALFLGNIFKILMKGRAPDHLLIERKDQALVASTFLDDFVTFTEMGINREYTKIENAKVYTDT